MSSTASGDGKRDVECDGEEGMLSAPLVRPGVTARVSGAIDGLATGPATVRGGVFGRVMASEDGPAAGPVVVV